MATKQMLLVEARGAVEWVTLNRPESGNALNKEMVDALIDYFEGLYEREDVRIVVLKASGRHFCVGLDLASGAFASQQRNPRNVGSAAFIWRCVNALNLLFVWCKARPAAAASALHWLQTFVLPEKVPR